MKDTLNGLKEIGLIRKRTPTGIVRSFSH